MEGYEREVKNRGIEVGKRVRVGGEGKLIIYLLYLLKFSLRFNSIRFLEGFLFRGASLFLLVYSHTLSPSWSFLPYIHSSFLRLSCHLTLLPFFIAPSSFATLPSGKRYNLLSFSGKRPQLLLSPALSTDAMRDATYHPHTISDTLTTVIE